MNDCVAHKKRQLWLLINNINIKFVIECFARRTVRRRDNCNNICTIFSISATMLRWQSKARSRQRYSRRVICSHSLGMFEHKTKLFGKRQLIDRESVSSTDKLRRSRCASKAGEDNKCEILNYVRKSVNAGEYNGTSQSRYRLLRK